MKIAVWDLLHGIAAQADDVLTFLEGASPDVVLLTGSHEDDRAFPLEPCFELGYYAKLRGASGADGVALLSVEPPRQVDRGALGPGLPTLDAVLAARIAGVRIAVAAAGTREVRDRARALQVWLTRGRAEHVLLGGTAASPDGFHEVVRSEGVVLLGTAGLVRRGPVTEAHGRRAVATWPDVHVAPRAPGVLPDELA